MSIVTSTNYSNPSFTRANAGSDQFEIGDVQNLALAVENHDHSNGNGLAVARLASGIAITNPAITGGTIAGATLTTPTISGATITGSALLSGRLQENQGASLLPISTLVLGNDGNYFKIITNTTTINLLDNTGWQGGSIVTLQFTTALILVHNAAASGSGRPMLLAGSVSINTTTNGMMVTLVFDQLSNVWREIARGIP